MKTTESTETRPYEKRLYNLWRSKLNDSVDFPLDWEEFIVPLRKQINYEGVLTEIEKQVLWQSGTAFKIGCTLVEDKKINGNNLPELAIETSGLQLIIYGTFLQLKEWVNKIQGENKQLHLLGKIKKYIKDDSTLNKFRNAIAHSGDDGNNTFFIFSNDQTIKIRTKQTITQIDVSVYTVLFASLLLWIVFSEWAYNKITPTN